MIKLKSFFSHSSDLPGGGGEGVEMENHNRAHIKKYEGLCAFLFARSFKPATQMLHAKYVPAYLDLWLFSLMFFNEKGM